MEERTRKEYSAYHCVCFGGDENDWSIISISSYGNSSLTNANIHYDCSPDDIPSTAILGDSNLDGTVSIKDATLIQKHIADIDTGFKISQSLAK